MTRYTIVESYLYDIDADTPEQARELFETYLQEGMMLEDDPETGIKFLQNIITIENEQGEEQ
jgi:hypothetical protein